jgi:hypothetical protein
VGEYGMPAGFLDLLLVSKQVSAEAREVFWTTTTFEFSEFGSLMSFLHMKRNVPVGRRQTPLYSGQLIRHINLSISWDDLYWVCDNMLYLVECFWTIARQMNATLKINFVKPEWVEDGSHLLKYGFDTTNNTSIFPAMLADMRAYQAGCRAAGVDLRVSQKKMDEWIVDEKMLAIKLPAIRRQKASARKGKKGKKGKKPSKKSSSK